MVKFQDVILPEGRACELMALIRSVDCLEKVLCHGSPRLAPTETTYRTDTLTPPERLSVSSQRAPPNSER